MRASGHVWYLPDAVRAEVQFVRQDNSAQPGAFLNVPVDLTPHIDSGLLSLCQPDTSEEATLFVRYATLFRSDGEAMCLALAESRGWLIATDDRKAIRVAQQAGLTVLSCPELIKTWADATRPDSCIARSCPERHPTAREVHPDRDYAGVDVVVQATILELIIASKSYGSVPGLFERVKKYHPKVRSPFAERKSSQHKKHRVGNDDRNAGLVEHIKIWPAPSSSRPGASAG